MPCTVVWGKIGTLISFPSFCVEGCGVCGVETVKNPVMRGHGLCDV